MESQQPRAGANVWPTVAEHIQRQGAVKRQRGVSAAELQSGLSQQSQSADALKNQPQRGLLQTLLMTAFAKLQQ